LEITMKSLPTPLSTAQLDALLSTIEKLPSATVNRDTHTVYVNAKRKATGEVVRVLDAVTFDGVQWHVMTVPGLVSPVAA
jgi:hypothetical protein